MYGLMLALTSDAIALAATALNRIAITAVELLLFLLAGVVPWALGRLRRRA
jgi:hypothetical protein